MRQTTTVKVQNDNQNAFHKEDQQHVCASGGISCQDVNRGAATSGAASMGSTAGMRQVTTSPGLAQNLHIAQHIQPQLCVSRVVNGARS